MEKALLELESMFEDYSNQFKYLLKEEKSSSLVNAVMNGEIQLNLTMREDALIKSLDMLDEIKKAIFTGRFENIIIFPSPGLIQRLENLRRNLEERYYEIRKERENYRE